MEPQTKRLDNRDVLAWLIKNGFGGSPFRLLPDTGFVNFVYAVGDDLILRVRKPGVDSLDSFTEAVAVPVAVAAEVLTPRLLQHDFSHDIFPTEVTLYERAPGVTLGLEEVDQRELPSLYRELGEQVGLLHENVRSCDDPHGWLDVAEYPDAREELELARQACKVESISRDWIARWLEILIPALGTCPGSVFLHNDLHSFNTLVEIEPLRLSSILDWGDAAWGDPMLDFETVPIWAVDWMLEGYESVRGPVEDGFFGRLLWHDIAVALETTRNPWVERSYPWQPLTTSRWINLIRLGLGDYDPRWKPWLPPGRP
jgi:hypothetical protein